MNDTMQIDFDAMQVGQVQPMPAGRKWEVAQRAEYNRAQECTRRTGMLFEVETVYKNTPAGNAPVGFTIKRTR